MSTGMSTGTMRAWRVAELGEPRDVMRLEEVPVPKAGPGEVVVKVLAAPANFPDVLMCRGLYQVKPDLPFTPGVELCGEVTELGEGVEGFSIGERVIGASVLPHGSFGEYAVMPARSTFPAPSSLGDAEAASLYIGYQTGWFGLHHRAHIQPGETLLVHAAGARVIGVVGGADKAEVARQLGADVVVDRHTEDFVQVVKEVTEGRGADVVYDPVGGETYTRSTKCIAFEGRILIIGFAGGEIQQAALNHALIKNYSIVGLHWGLYGTVRPELIRPAHDELVRLCDSGALAPVVSEKLALEEVADGVQRLADGVTVGRVVFTA
jgi:NADPH2:quinone reductase